jgi:hypothetical protein
MERTTERALAWDGGLGAAMAPAWFGFLPAMWGYVAEVAGAVIGTLSGSTGEVIA